MNILDKLAVTIDVGPGGDVKNVPTVSGESVFTGVLTLIYFAAGVACVVVIIVAGIYYSISQGDSAKIANAKNAILYSVVGLVVILLAFTITQFVIGGFN